MKIAVKDLTDEMLLELQGNEIWLERLYADFAQGPGERPKLTGTLKISTEAGGGVLVRGQLNYQPLIACARCDRDVPLPLSITLESRVLPPSANPDLAENSQRDRLLSRDELDVYFLIDGCVDLEVLINDAIQTEVPMRYVPVADDGKTCRICVGDLSQALVYGDGQKANSPFSKLEALKLKH